MSNTAFWIRKINTLLQGADCRELEIIYNIAFGMLEKAQQKAQHAS